MEVSRSKVGAARREERGFTLPEVLITIVLIGIVMAIASSTWFGVVESRAVDSATNQLASDLRLAHTSSTNQLAAWAVVRDPTTAVAALVCGATGDYYLIKIPSSGAPTCTARSFEEDRAQVDTEFNLKFNPNGSAEALAGSPTTITVGSNDGDPASGPEHDIQVNTNTSRIKID